MEVTMTSLELVQFINNQRDAGESELRHDHFMEKVPKVLGEGAPKFRDTYTQSRFTPKGVEWVAGRWNSRKPTN